MYVFSFLHIQFSTFSFSQLCGSLLLPLSYCFFTSPSLCSFLPSPLYPSLAHASTPGLWNFLFLQPLQNWLHNIRYSGRYCSLILHDKAVAVPQYLQDLVKHLLYIDYNYEVEQVLYYKRTGASRRFCLDCREGVVCHNQVCRLLF